MSDSSADGEVVAPDPAVIERNTSGVVGVLAEALAQHQFGEWWEVSKPDGKRVSCACEWAYESDGLFSWEAEKDAHAIHRAHVASVVAALPNIAVVSLPEGENRWHVTDWDGGRVSLCYGVDTVRCYLPNPALEVVEAEELGIALIAASRYLAAARAAGGQA